jgi:hypothetical protein
MSNPFINTPIVQGCNGFAIPSAPPQGPGTAYIEQTINQEYFQTNLSSVIDMTNVIQGTPGFSPECIEIYNPCGADCDMVIQYGQYMQRLRVPAGFTCRRKLVYTATPFQIFMKWDGLINGLPGSPFAGHVQNSFFRIRLFNFPMNDIDESMWHPWGELTEVFNQFGAGNRVFFDPTDNSLVYKITKIQIFSQSSAATSTEIGFYSTMYVPVFPSSAVQPGMITYLQNQPAGATGQFVIYDVTADPKKGILVPFGNSFNGFNQVGSAAVMTIVLDIDAFDPQLGQAFGMLG